MDPDSAELGDILTTPQSTQHKTYGYLTKKKQKTHTTNNHHVSTLQHAIYAHPHHKLIKEGIGRIGHFSTSPTGIFNMSLLDHNSTYFPR